ncbi:MAG: hypothetical protein Q8O58_03940, partial [Gallionella sp.]|nr:hypothetical protein [Gallionella sp.]
SGKQAMITSAARKIADFQHEWGNLKLNSVGLYTIESGGCICSYNRAPFIEHFIEEQHGISG